MTDRDRIPFGLFMAVRKVPRGILRDLGKRRFPPDDLPEKIVTEAILEHLHLCGWHLEHHIKPTVTPARSEGVAARTPASSQTAYSFCFLQVSLSRLRRSRRRS